MMHTLSAATEAGSGTRMAETGWPGAVRGRANERASSERPVEHLPVDLDRETGAQRLGELLGEIGSQP
jgi:hypothetical protein